mmetsp:Transcript_1907/g.2526  ORF Transcript_1907/g.2526 Transcript_1907/m.2526 type:complete len:223 (-) Transcript_1907:437-1105(-)
MLVQSKQSEIDILKESKQSQIDILKESLKELKDVWKDLDQTKETTILNLRTELATTLANHYAVEFTRIIIEHAALRTQAIRDATKKLTASDATIKLSAELFLDQDIDSNNICDQTNEWLEKLVYPSPLTLRLKKDVIAALKKNQFKHLSPRHQYIADAPNGLYFGDGPDPDRFAHALIVLKAQYLGAYNHEVILLNFEKKPTWILLDGDIFPYQYQGQHYHR